MDAIKSLMASPKRLLEAVGEYVADKVVGPVPTMQSLEEASALTHPPVAAPAVAAPAVAIKRQSVAAPVVAVKRQSIAAPTVARGGGVKKASPGSKKKVSPLKTVKPEPVSKKQARVSLGLAADWPRPRGSPRHALALGGASGVPAGRRLSQLHFDDRSEPVRDLPKRSSRPKAGGAGFYSEANLQTLA